MSNYETGGSASARQADKMLCGNVGHEQRRADKEPSNVTAGKKVLFGSPLPPGKVNANAEHQREIGQDDDDVRGCQGPVTRLDQRRVEHPLLLFGPSGATMPSEAARKCDGEVYNRRTKEIGRASCRERMYMSVVASTVG